MEPIVILVVVSLFTVSMAISTLTVYTTKSTTTLQRGAFAGRFASALLLGMFLRAFVSNAPFGEAIGIVISVVFVIYTTRCTIFRCNDAGLSRKLAILVGIPLLGLFVPLVLMFAESKQPAPTDLDARDNAPSEGTKTLPDATA